MKGFTAKNVGLAATVLTAIAGLGTWLFPGGIGLSIPGSNATIVTPQQAHDQQVPEEESRSKLATPKSAERVIEPMLQQPTKGLAALRSVKAPNPRIFSFVDQEQKTLVPGRASLAVAFHEIGKEEFLSVRVNVGVESTTYAVLGAGDRFTIICGSKQYLASILLIDRAAGAVRVSVEPSQRSLSTQPNSPQPTSSN